MHFADGNPLLSDSPTAWNNLIEAVGPASLLVVIESRMSRALRQVHAADDVLQEALMHAWRDRSECEWRGVKAFRSWLLTLIDHRIGHLAGNLAAQKRGAGVRTYELSALGAGNAGGEGWHEPPTNIPGPVGSTTPSRIAIYREQAAAMHSALGEMAAELREVVQLRLFEQLTLDEIAKKLGLTVAAVRYRFGRGSEQYQRALRRHLSGLWPAGRESAAAPNEKSSP